MSLTRRSFAGLLALGSSALARTSGYVEHRIFRRPWTWDSALIQKPGYEWRSLSIFVDHTAPLRVIVRRPGLESLVEAMIQPSYSGMGPYRVQSIVGLKADGGITVRLESSQEFKLHRIISRFSIESGRIRTWVDEHHQTLGNDSEMGRTFIVDEMVITKGGV